MTVQQPTYVTHTYPYPLPKTNEKTERLKAWEKVANIGMVFGAGIALKSIISRPCIGWAALGLGIIGLSMSIKSLLSQIDSPIYVPDPSRTRPLLRTRLSAAAEKGNRLMVNILLFFGANPNSKDSPLHLAVRGPLDARTHNLGLLEDLLKSGADVNKSLLFFGTPLSWALHGDSKFDDKAAILFLKYGANPNEATASHCSPLFIAALKGRTNVVKELLDAGALIDRKEEAEGFNQWTPLFAAVNSRQVEVVKLLVERGADKEAVNQNGQTPLEYADVYQRSLDAGVFRLENPANHPPTMYTQLNYFIQSPKLDEIKALLINTRV